MIKTLKKNSKKYIKLFAKTMLASDSSFYLIVRHLISGFFFIFSLFLGIFSERYSNIFRIYAAVFSFRPDDAASIISANFYPLKKHLVIASRAFFEIAFSRGELFKPCFFWEKTTHLFPDLFAPWKLLHYSYYYTQSWAELEEVNGRYELYRKRVLNDVEVIEPEVILGDHVTASIGHSQIFYFFKILGALKIANPPKISLLPSALDRMSDFYDVLMPNLIANRVAIKIKKGHQYPSDLENFIQDSFPFLVTKKYFNFFDGKGRAKFLADWVRMTKKPFAITESQAKELRQFLENVGLVENDWYVVIHVRQTADSQIRNSNIETYYEAIKTITSKGGWVFRIGDTDMTPLPKNINNVVDLPFSCMQKPRYLDLYLLSTARFMIGTCSGPCDIPFFYNVPRLITNWPFMTELFGSPNDLCLPVAYWDNILNRVVTLTEQLSSSNYDSEPWIRSQDNVSLVLNSSKQINYAVEEMIELTAENIKSTIFPPLRADSLANQYKDKVWFMGKIAQSFLEDNPNYLD